jgi:hypothetical protein
VAVGLAGKGKNGLLGVLLDGYGPNRNSCSLEQAPEGHWHKHPSLGTLAEAVPPLI